MCRQCNVSVLERDIGEMSSISGQVTHIHVGTNTLKRGVDQSLLFPDIGKIAGQTGIFSCDWQQVQNDNFEFKTVQTPGKEYTVVMENIMKFTIKCGAGLQIFSTTVYELDRFGGI